jgi:hypothetical protein
MIEQFGFCFLPVQLFNVFFLHSKQQIKIIKRIELFKNKFIFIWRSHLRTA